MEIGGDATIADALAAVRSAADEIEAYYYVYVNDPEGRLVGAISLRHLLMANPQDKLTQVLQPRLITVLPDTPVSEVAEIFLRYNFLTLPVVDEETRLKGVVSIKHAFDELLPYFYRHWKADKP
jgi:magnesium transporter